MKVLLTALNAKYIHSNLAVYSLKAYASKYKDHIELVEFTINQYTDEILRKIYKKSPDVIAFSCYIWNIKLVEELICELHKILPHVKIWLGGPEVSYDAEKALERMEYIDGVMIGEGEATFLELMDYFMEGSPCLDNIKGLAFRKTNGETGTECKRKGQIVNTSPREQLDLSTIPFTYNNIEIFKNRIIYYESSRGCPYSCSYCLSSINKRVRFRNLDLVKKELKYFLDHKVPQVKFVDRTFNCNRDHAMEIWRFVKEEDNGSTNFHFEISADIIEEKELELLSSLRPGLVQLEIGVQTTNIATIEAIDRKMDLVKLKYVVQRINQSQNIHQHLDLIAGLPYEDYKTFQSSFNEVYSLKPEQLQLGFLKVLKGSSMFEKCEKNGIIYKSIAPYEVLSTKWLDYGEILKLKALEEMVEVYYNSGQFTNSVEYLLHFHESPFDMYESLSNYYEERDFEGLGKSRISRYNILLEYFQDVIKEEDKPIKNILLYDLYLRENLKSRPKFALDNAPYKDRYRAFYLKRNNGMGKNTGSLSHIEHFEIDILKTVKEGAAYKGDYFILFDYQNRNPLNYEAAAIVVDGV